MGAVADFDLRLPAIRTLVLEDIAAGLPVAADTRTSRRRQGGGAAAGKAKEARWQRQPDKRRR
jgi:hypothetical protein